MSSIAAVLAVMTLLPGPALRDWRTKELRVSEKRLDRYDEVTAKSARLPYVAGF